METNNEMAAWCIVERPECAPTWIRCGKGTLNRDGSVNVQLDALPISGELHIRPKVPQTKVPEAKPLCGPCAEGHHGEHLCRGERCSDLCHGSAERTLDIMAATLADIAEALWPNEDPHAVWTADTMAAVAEAMRRAGFGPQG